MASEDLPEQEKAQEETAGSTDLELLDRRNKAFQSDKSLEIGRNFTPRPTDVFIATYPKCGTTWVTQICHQLRTGGHMDFEEICDVVPWDILAHDCGQDLEAEHVANPRLWKSHEAARDIAKGGKYITICRDPDDVLISFYRFLPAMLAMANHSITMEEFVEAVFCGVAHSESLHDFYVGWWERRNDPNVLWLCYEDLHSDIDKQIRRIAAFIGVPLNDELLAKVKEMSSFEFMQARSGQFDEHVIFEKVRDQMEIPKDYKFGDAPVSKVRAGGGTIGEKEKLSAKVREMMRNQWENVVYAKTGLRSYADMQAAVSQL
uniref:Sulfotransferase domain-containing protein n=1 Tax=Alexandrium monilatum TaxID=311494 RepID=A0A7S4VRT1_9DINO|mmetsp:Transcript_75538/g.225184  ORF Transcript_75538/g.225184 Transcript_75538/m.225184 type:complete len:318 (+) Transcript_75538:80-1033(+)